MISTARDHTNTRSALPRTSKAEANRALTCGRSKTAAAPAATPTSRARPPLRSAAASTRAAAARPSQAARSNVATMAEKASAAATIAGPRRRTGTSPVAIAPASSASSTLALCPKVSREVKKPIAPYLPAAPGASTQAGCSRSPRRWTRSIPVRYCTSPTAEESASPAAAQSTSRRAWPGASDRPWNTIQKPSALRQSVADAAPGEPYRDTASESSATPISASSGTSSGLRPGRQPEAAAQTSPAAAMPSPICVPAIEIGQKNACANKPSGTSSPAACLTRTKTPLYQNFHVEWLCAVAAGRPHRAARDGDAARGRSLRHPAAPGGRATPPAQRGGLLQRDHLARSGPRDGGVRAALPGDGGAPRVHAGPAARHRPPGGRPRAARARHRRAVAAAALPSAVPGGPRARPRRGGAGPLGRALGAAGGEPRPERRDQAQPQIWAPAGRVQRRPSALHGVRRGGRGRGLARRADRGRGGRRRAAPGAGRDRPGRGCRGRGAAPPPRPGRVAPHRAARRDGGALPGRDLPGRRAGARRPQEPLLRGRDGHPLPRAGAARRSDGSHGLARRCDAAAGRGRAQVGAAVPRGVLPQPARRRGGTRPDAAAQEARRAARRLMGRVLRTALLLALVAGGAACRPDVPILTWHSIGGAGDEFTVSQAAFAAQLDALRSAGFHTVTFHEWLEHEDRGAPLPEKPFLLTFDDGYQDALTAALPALRARGMRATFFLVSAWIGADDAHRSAEGERGRRYLSWPEVRMLAAAAMEIGSHGATHTRLPELTEEQAMEELTRSKRQLESGLAAPVEVFAYPYNASRRRLRALARKAGYRAAVSGRDHGAADRYELYRSAVQRDTLPEQLLRDVRQ